MCGIYGYKGKVIEKKKKLVTKLMKRLAIETEVRGIHSTGYFAVNDEYVYTEKDTCKASEFVKDSFIKKRIVDDNCSIFIGHNRNASIGKISRVNAHPFSSDNYTMVHNGTVKENDLLLEKYKVKSKLKGTTDSETILKILDKTKNLKKVLTEISCYSLVIYDHEKDKLFFARDHMRPLYVADFRKMLGIWVFASTKKILQKALKTTFKNKIGLKNRGFKTSSYVTYTINKKNDFIEEFEYSKNYSIDYNTNEQSYSDEYSEEINAYNRDYWNRRYNKWSAHDAFVTHSY